MKAIIYIELREKVTFSFKNPLRDTVQDQHPDWTLISLDNLTGKDVLEYTYRTLEEFEEIKLYFDDEFFTGIGTFRNLFNRLMKTKNLTEIHSTTNKNTVLNTYTKSFGFELDLFKKEN